MGCKDGSALTYEQAKKDMERREELKGYLMCFVKYCCMEPNVAPGDMAILPEIAKLLWSSIAP